MRYKNYLILFVAVVIACLGVYLMSTPNSLPRDGDGNGLQYNFNTEYEAAMRRLDEIEVRIDTMNMQLDLIIKWYETMRNWDKYEEEPDAKKDP